MHRRISNRSIRIHLHQRGSRLAALLSGTRQKNFLLKVVVLGPRFFVKNWRVDNSLPRTFSTVPPSISLLNSPGSSSNPSSSPWNLPGRSIGTHPFKIPWNWPLNCPCPPSNRYPLVAHGVVGFWTRQVLEILHKLQRIPHYDLQFLPLVLQIVPHYHRRKEAHLQAGLLHRYLHHHYIIQHRWWLLLDFFTHSSGQQDVVIMASQ